VTRRTAIALIAAASPAVADERSDILEAVDPLAVALTDGDAGAFIRRIPADAPNYAELRDNVRALVAQAEVSSSVVVLKVENGAAELDWSMRIRSRATEMLLERRRGIVHVRVDRGKIKSLEPATFFASAKQ
jgi:hypothetical protein